MKPWPYDAFEIESPLTPEAVSAVLESVRLDHDPLLPSKGSAGSFFGWVEERDFKLQHVTSWRNGLSPVIEGRIDPYRDGSSIRVRMRPHALMILIAGTLLASTAASTVQLLLAHGGQVLAPFAFAAIYGAVMWGFWQDATASAVVLRRLLSARSAD